MNGCARMSFLNMAAREEANRRNAQCGMWTQYRTDDDIYTAIDQINQVKNIYIAKRIKAQVKRMVELQDSLYERIDEMEKELAQSELQIGLREETIFMQHSENNRLVKCIKQLLDSKVTRSGTKY